jgi:hypothetical protein
MAEAAKWVSDKQQQELAFPKKIANAKKEVMGLRH